METEKQEVYESIAEAMRGYGYRDVTAADVREIDEAPPTEERPHVIALFAGQQLHEAREAGRLPPAADQSQRSTGVEQQPPGGREQNRD